MNSQKVFGDFLCMPDISHLLTASGANRFQPQARWSRVITDWEDNHHDAIPIGHISMHTVNCIGQCQLTVVAADAPLVFAYHPRAVAPKQRLIVGDYSLSAVVCYTHYWNPYILHSDVLI